MWLSWLYKVKISVWKIALWQQWNPHTHSLLLETWASSPSQDESTTISAQSHKTIQWSGGCFTMDLKIHLFLITHKHETSHRHGSGLFRNASHSKIPLHTPSSPWDCFGFRSLLNFLLHQSTYKTLAAQKLLQSCTTKTCFGHKSAHGVSSFLWPTTVINQFLQSANSGSHWHTPFFFLMGLLDGA